MLRIVVLVFVILFGSINIFSVLVPINYPFRIINKFLEAKGMKIADQKSFYFNPFLLSFSSDYLKVETIDKNGKTIIGKFENISFNPIFRTFSVANGKLALSFDLNEYSDYITILQELKNITNSYNLSFTNFEISLNNQKTLFFDKFSIFNIKNTIDIDMISRIKTNNDNNFFKSSLNYDFSTQNLNSFLIVCDLFEMKYFNNTKNSIYFKVRNISNLLQIDDFLNSLLKDFKLDQSFQLDGEFSQNNTDFFYGEIKLDNKKYLKIKGTKENNNNSFIIEKDNDINGSKDSSKTDVLLLEKKNLYLASEKVIAEDNSIIYEFLSFIKPIIKFNLKGELGKIKIDNENFQDTIHKLSFDLNFNETAIDITTFTLNSSNLDIDIKNNKLNIIDNKLLFLPDFIKNSNILIKDKPLVFNLNGDIDVKFNNFSIQQGNLTLNQEDIILLNLELNNHLKKINLSLENIQLEKIINIDEVINLSINNSSESSNDVSNKQKLLMYYFSNKDEYTFSVAIQNSKIKQFLIKSLLLEANNLSSKKSLKIYGDNDFFSGSFLTEISKDDSGKYFNIDSRLSILDLLKIKQILNIDKLNFDTNINIPSFLGFDGKVNIFIDNLIANYNNNVLNFHQLSIKTDIGNGIINGKIEDKDYMVMNIAIDLQSTPKYNIGYSFSSLDIKDFITNECPSINSYIKGGILSFQGKISSFGFNPLKILQTASGNGLAYLQNLAIENFDLNFMARNLLYKKTNWKEYLKNKGKISYIPKINLTYKVIGSAIDGSFNFEKDLISGNGSFKWNSDNFLFEDFKGVFVLGAKNHKDMKNVYIYVPFAARIKCQNDMFEGIIDWKNLENFIANISQ